MRLQSLRLRLAVFFFQRWEKAAWVVARGSAIGGTLDLRGKHSGQTPGALKKGKCFKTVRAKRKNAVYYQRRDLYHLSCCKTVVT